MLWIHVLVENVKTIKNTIHLRTKAKLCSCCMQLENKRNISFEHYYERLRTLHTKRVDILFVIRSDLDSYVSHENKRKSPLASGKKARRKQMCQMQKSVWGKNTEHRNWIYCVQMFFGLWSVVFIFWNITKVPESWIIRSTAF